MSPCPPCSERMYGDIFLEVLEIDLSNLLREMFKTRVLKTHTRDVRGGAGRGKGKNPRGGPRRKSSLID